MIARAAALALAALAAGACAKGQGDDDAPGDAGTDGPSCRDNECVVQDSCVLPTVCNPVYPGLVCAAGEWLSTCGNGRCDCGERPDACGQDCTCESPTCVDGPGCVQPETCKSDGTASLCRAGLWVDSCGDGTCNCGETMERCVRDCPPEEPFWSECVSRTGQYDSCEQYCESIGLRCAEDCTTTLRRPNWGAESWPEGENCEGTGTSQALCADSWGDGVGAAPHWKCCCAAP